MNGTEIWSIDGIVDVLCDFEHRDTCNFTWIQEIEIAIFRRGERSSSSRNFYNPDSRVSRITRYTRKWLTRISNFSFEISKDRRWTPQFSIFSTIKKFFQETREETNLFPFHCSFFSGKEKKKEFTAKAEWDRNAIPRCYANRERKSNTKTYTKLATPVQLDPVNRASRGCWRCLRVGNGCRAREQRRWWNQDRPPSRRGYSSPLLPLIYISVGW